MGAIAICRDPADLLIHLSRCLDLPAKREFFGRSQLTCARPGHQRYTEQIEVANASVIMERWES
jgi:hypothetical protein